MMMYTAALALRHIGMFRALPWGKLTLLGFIPVMAYVIMPSKLYDGGSAFLAYNATMFAPPAIWPVADTGSYPGVSMNTKPLVVTCSAYL